MNPAIKDPSEKLDYSVDWSDFLADAETITGTPEWTLPSGITKDSQSNTTTSAVIWLTGGTHGEEYVIACKITTSASRIAERSIKILCRNR